MRKMVAVICVLLAFASVFSCSESGAGEGQELREAELRNEIGLCNKELEACTESLMFTYTECSALPYSRRRVELLEHKDSLLFQLHLLGCRHSECGAVESVFSGWRKLYEDRCRRAEDSICTVDLGDDAESNLEYYEQQADLLYNKEVWLVKHLGTY